MLKRLSEILRSGSEGIPEYPAAGSDYPAGAVSYFDDEPAAEAHVLDLKSVEQKNEVEPLAGSGVQVNQISKDEKADQVPEAAKSPAPTPEALARHVAEIRRTLPPERAQDAIAAITRQYNRARTTYGLPPALPSGATNNERSGGADGL